MGRKCRKLPAILFSRHQNGEKVATIYDEVARADSVIRAHCLAESILDAMTKIMN